MKQLSVLFSAVLLFVATSAVKAQKIAHLDVNAILSIMPEKKAADQKLENLSKTKMAEIEKQAQAWQAEVAAYQQGAAKMTEAQRKAKEEELTKKQQSIQQLQQAAQKDLAEKTDAEYAPIEKKFSDAVNKVAKANGWDYVLDANSSVFIYKAGTDATPAVKKELGL